MFANYNVLHIAPTPLVGAPAKVVKALVAIGVNARCIILSEYPDKSGLRGFFVEGTDVLNLKKESDVESFIDIVKWADIIHVHNFLPDDAIDILKFHTGKTFVYQVHSPLREGPVFISRLNEYPFSFAKKLVLAQYHPRHYPDYTMVPNLVFSDPVCKPRDLDNLKVLYTPTHARGGRWNSKGDPRISGIFENLTRNFSVELVSIDKPVSPGELFEIRAECHVSIDEIITGAYHQVSLEGLAASNVVINAADFFSMQMLKMISGADRMPPFIHATVDTLYNVLSRLSECMDEVFDIIKESERYHLDYLGWEKLILRYVDVYEKL